MLANQQEEIEPFLELTPELVQKRRSQGRIIFDRFIRNRAAMIGAVFLILLFLFCFAGPMLTGHNSPDAIHATNVSDTLAGPSWNFPLGTDEGGRDTMARAMAGGQGFLLLAMTSMLMAIFLSGPGGDRRFLRWHCRQHSHARDGCCAGCTAVLATLRAVGILYRWLAPQCDYIDSCPELDVRGAPGAW